MTYVRCCALPIESRVWLYSCRNPGYQPQNATCSTSPLPPGPPHVSGGGFHASTQKGPEEKIFRAFLRGAGDVLNAIFSGIQRSKNHMIKLDRFVAKHFLVH